MRSACVLVCLFIIFTHAHVAPFRRYSLIPPYESDNIVGWIQKGSTSVQKDFIRLTNTSLYTNSILSNPIPFNEKNFEASLEVRIHSKAEIGADGMVFWLTKSVVDLGNAFGGPGLYFLKCKHILFYLMIM